MGAKCEKLNFSGEQKIGKNVKKSLAQEVCQKSDILERRTPLLYLQHSHWVTVQLVRGHLTPKMNITFFIRN